MACVGAYDCPDCGEMRTTAEGSKDPFFAPYAAVHVCPARCDKCGRLRDNKIKSACKACA